MGEGPRPPRLGAFAFAALLVGAAAVLPSAAGAQEHFREEMRHLLSSNPRIEVDRRLLGAAAAGMDEAFGLFLPSVDLTGDVGYTYVDSPARRSSFDDAFTGDRKKVTLSITQNVFDGFRKQSAYDGAGKNKEAAGHGLRVTRQGVLFAGARAYLGVLRAVRLLDLARTSEANIQRQLSLEDERVRRGSGLSVDVLQAKSRLQIAKERRVAIEGQFQDALARYGQVFGHPPEVPAMQLVVPADTLLPDNVETAVGLAESDNPLVRQRGSQIEAAEARRVTVRSAYYPRFDLVARANYEEDVEGVKGPKRDAAVLVQMTWNLFAGGSTTAASRRASEEMAAAVANRDTTGRQVVEEVRLAFDSLRNAQERVALLENAVTIAEEVYQARETLRAAGRETAISVLDAENEWNNARITLASAQFDAHLAGYRLLAAMGHLTPENLGI